MSRPPVCPSCEHAFATKDPVRPHGQYMPLLLNCGHVFCEGCLSKLVKKQDFLLCPTCQRETKLKQNGDIKCLWPDLYTLGSLVANRKSLHARMEIKLMPAGGSVGKKKAGEKRRRPVMCNECSQQPATVRCPKCECSVCGLCFQKIHESSRTLRKHQAVPIDASERFESPSPAPVASPSPIPSGCADHDNRPIEYYCEDDQTAICSHCVIVGKHKNHAISSMEEKNMKAVTEIEPLLGASLNVLRRLRKSDKVISCAIPDAKLEVDHIADQLHTHFQQLHRALQAREVSILAELEVAAQMKIGPLEEMRRNINEEMQQLQFTIRDGQKVVGGTSPNSICAQQVADRLRAVQDLPCHAVRPPDDSLPIAKLECDKELPEHIAKHGTIRTLQQMSMRLVPLSEVPVTDVDEEDRDSEVSSTSGTGSYPSLPSQPQVKDWAAEMDRLSETSDRSCPSSAPNEQKVASSTDTVSLPRKKALRKSRLQFIRSELVQVTHIKHPTHFMVQRCSDLKKLANLSRQMNKWGNSAESNSEIPILVEVDDLVLAKYTDNDWYRAQVRKVFVDNATGSVQAQVIYIDYGNTEVVEMCRLRKMQERFTKLQEMATRCALYDVVPADESNEWTEEAVYSFARMIGDKPVLMTVMKMTDVELIVDLSTPACGEANDDDGYVSVRDALVFLECGCFVSPATVPISPGGQRPGPKRQFLRPQLPMAGQRMGVILSHIDSPDSFYIQQIGEDAQYLASMMAEMQTTYTEDSGNLWTVLCPQKDMICVAQYADNSWYRAQVINLPGRKEVDVRYVDFGDTQRISHWRLRRLLDKFRVLPAQAVHCGLADIAPVDDGEQWPKEAVQLLSQFNVRQLTMKVTDVQGGKLSILLYDLNAEPTVGINSLLVSRGLAKTTGPGSVPSDIISPKPGTCAEVANRMVSSHPENAKMMPLEITSPRTTEAPQVFSPTSSTDPSSVPSTPQTSRQTSLNEDLAPGVQIVISHSESPGKFFVQMATAKEEGLNQLMSDLQAKYRDSEPTNISWQLEDYCAASCSRDGSGEIQWYRAKIRTKPKEDTVEVFLLDYGFTDTIPTSRLRMLADEFQGTPCFTIQCHLADVQPAGDISKWSKTSCEFLSEFLVNKIFYLDQKGNIESGSLPVDLLLEEFVQGDALTADRTEFQSVSRLMRDKGLALPARRPKTPTKSPKPSEGTTTWTQGTASTKVERSKPTPPPPGFRPKSPSPKSVKEEEDGALYPTAPMDIVCNGSIFDKGDAVTCAGGDAFTDAIQKASLKETEPVKKKQFKPPDIPSEKTLKVVPTFVDYDCVIYVQEIKEAESSEGEFGFILHESSLEATIQDRFLKTLGLGRRRIPGDGNCLFRACAEGIFQQQGHHDTVRDAVVRTLDKQWDLFKHMLGDVNKDHYLAGLMAPGAFGGEVEIRVITYLYHIRVVLYLGGLEHEVRTHEYGDDANSPLLLLYTSDGHHDCGHYDLVVPIDGASSGQSDVQYMDWRCKQIDQMQHLLTNDNSVYDNSLLQQIQDHLKSKYEESSPPPQEETWEVGQACIAQFSMDGAWYRARIKNITEHGAIQVSYIDYGNVEFVNHDKLRSDVILTDIPQQCLECELHGLQPASADGKWEKQILDFIHAELVDKTCTIVIKEEPVYGARLQVQIITPLNQDMSQVLLRKGEARKEGEMVSTTTPHLLGQTHTNGEVDMAVGTVPESMEKTGESLTAVTQDQPEGKVPDRQVASPYRHPQSASIGDILIGTVTGLHQPNEVYLQQIQWPDPPDLMRQEVNRQLNQLVEMSVEMNKNYSYYSPLRAITAGMPCCAEYSEDGCWYRGEIITVVGDYAGVLFVDYGNSEYRHMNKLRELPSQFMDLPVQAVKCRLYGLQPTTADGSWPDGVEQQLAEILRQAGNVVGLVKDDGCTMSIELYYELPEQGANLELVYQPLVDSGLAQLVPFDPNVIVEEEYEVEETNGEREEDSSDKKPDVADNAREKRSVSLEVCSGTGSPNIHDVEPTELAMPGPKLSEERTQDVAGPKQVVEGVVVTQGGPGGKPGEQTVIEQGTPV